ncbi:hypothetical protein [Paraburkholderia acidiphila]|uniref:Uncharacterized protein n=1 Tax=Paraburkholderia acidiphila TaxID=2571747 RepID=A0A7Z2G5S1_9BURK|nr:hypothetical protein [Paraburkholderia acidiphila]QGZ55571.1 hypothetical protein FAZ97_11985 [Paraburkholderia acidiphila]
MRGRRLRLALHCEPAQRAHAAAECIAIAVEVVTDRRGLARAQVDLALTVDLRPRDKSVRAYGRRNDGQIDELALRKEGS